MEQKVTVPLPYVVLPTNIALLFSFSEVAKISEAEALP